MKEVNITSTKAAQKVDFSYSSAKKVFKRFRSSLQNKAKTRKSAPPASLHCGYYEISFRDDKDVEGSGKCEIKLISTVAGQSQSRA